MSVIPITISWDPKKGKIQKVSPDPVTLKWLNKDVAQFILESNGDDAARITNIWFEGSEAKGPFHHLAATPYTHDKAWTGANLIEIKKTYKYSVAVSGKAGTDELDPLMEIVDGP